MNWRFLTLLLFAANFIYWAWHSWIQVPQGDLVDHQFSADAPELVIVEELTQATSTNLSANSPSSNSDASVPPNGMETPTLTMDASLGSDADVLLDPVNDNSEPSPAVAKVCHRVGFFVDKSEIEKAQAWMETENLNSQVKTSTENVFVGYWVYLPAYPNSAAAAQVVDALQEKNIQDLFVETRAPNQNAISLGLFRQRTGAEQRLKQVQALGFPAKIRNREPEQTVYWLEFEMEGGKPPPLARIPVGEGQVRRLERQDCAP